MTTDLALSVTRQGTLVALEVVTPLLAVGLIVGLVISVFQAATQIQESTLAFVPKLFAILGATALLGHWCLHKLVAFSLLMMTELGKLGGAQP